MIKWGIIGTGKIAETFANDLALVDDAALYAVASRSQDNANRFAKSFPGVKAYSSYDALVGDSRVDAVYIATPHSSHARDSINALRAKKAVLCEKPFTINHTEATRVIDQARDSNTLLVEGMWTYFQPAFQRLLEIIRSGALGRILSINADLGFKAQFDPHSRLFDPEKGGGALLDMGIYNVALVSALLGEPKEIVASANFGSSGVDDSTNMLIKYPRDVTASLECSIVGHASREAVIVLEKGIIRIPDPWWHFTEIKIQKSDGTVEIFKPDRTGYGFTHEIREFQRCLKLGLVESPIMTWENTLKNMQVLDAVRAQIGLVYPQDLRPM